MILLNQRPYLRRHDCPIKAHHQQLTLLGLSLEVTGKRISTYQCSIEVIPYRTKLLLAHRDGFGGVNFMQKPRLRRCSVKVARPTGSYVSHAIPRARYTTRFTM